MLNYNEKTLVIIKMYLRMVKMVSGVNFVLE